MNRQQMSLDSSDIFAPNKKKSLAQHDHGDIKRIQHRLHEYFQGDGEEEEDGDVQRRLDGSTVLRRRIRRGLDTTRLADTLRAVVSQAADISVSVLPSSTLHPWLEVSLSQASAGVSRRTDGGRWYKQCANGTLIVFGIIGILATLLLLERLIRHHP